jgi:hypothetical protein
MRIVGMSYKPGDLKRTKECGHAACISEDTFVCDVDYETQRSVSDSRSRETRYQLGSGIVYLEHSCDEWVIGGPEEIKALMSDLDAVLRERTLEK